MTKGRRSLQVGDSSTGYSVVPLAMPSRQHRQMLRHCKKRVQAGKNSEVLMELGSGSESLEVQYALNFHGTMISLPVLRILNNAD